MTGSPTPGPWRVGKGGAVVSDSREGLPKRGGFLDWEYYGGYLIAESCISSPNAELLASAPTLALRVENLQTSLDEASLAIKGMRDQLVRKTELESVLQAALERLDSGDCFHDDRTRQIIAKGKAALSGDDSSDFEVPF